jgi:hypothetical protein
MFGLNDNFIIVSGKNVNDITSILYAKEYLVTPIKSYYNGIYENCVIATNNVSNDDFRRDALFLLNHFIEDNFIIKYRGEKESKRISSNGSERLLETIMYNTDINNLSYLYNGYSFSFIESKRYWKPNKKEDFRVGMIVEYFNNEKWYNKEVIDPVNEYDKMYKLLIKYDKIRVLSTN